MAASTDEYGIAIAKDVMTPMRDGVSLASDIYWPALPDGSRAPGKFPTILGRTSYDKANPWMWIGPVAEYFTRRGYVTVLQDLRGRGKSEGTGGYGHSYNPKEGPDGYDTVEWIAAQEWSNGRVGMVGSSHGGTVQTIAALHHPPHLSALWLDVPISTAFDTVRPGGAFTLWVLGALFLHLHDAQEVVHDPQGQAWISNTLENLRAYLWQPGMKRGESPFSLVPSLEDTYFHYIHDTTLSDWWRDESVCPIFHMDRFADIPVTISGGWHDQFAGDNANQFQILTRQNKSQTRLILGPWNHQTMRAAGSSVVGEVDHGPEALWGDDYYNEERLRWFDRYLKDVDTGVENDSPVRVFVMGGGSGAKTKRGHLEHGGRWRDEQEWPPARATSLTAHLTGDGRLDTGDAPADEGSLTWVHDPDHPVPTLGGAVCAFYEWVKVPPELNPVHVTPRARMRTIVPDGPMHQRERPDQEGCRAPYPLLSQRADVQVFRTAPLERDMEVTGSPKVNLWVSSSALDTDFTAKLVEEYPPTDEWPDGFHMSLTDVLLRMRFREGFEREVLMEPDKVYEITLTLPPFANLFKAGHRLRLDVASSNFPRFDVNPGTGEPLARHTHSVKAQNTLHLGGARPSALVLPVVPRS